MKGGSISLSLSSASLSYTILMPISALMPETEQRKYPSHITWTPQVLTHATRTLWSLRQSDIRWGWEWNVREREEGEVKGQIIDH